MAEGIGHIPAVVVRTRINGFGNRNLDTPIVNAVQVPGGFWRSPEGSDANDVVAIVAPVLIPTEEQAAEQEQVEQQAAAPEILPGSFWQRVSSRIRNIKRPA